MKEEKRLTYYDIASKGSEVKTFDGKTYELKGTVAIENSTGEVAQIAQIYYRVRSVRDGEKKLIAKRKNKQAELVAITPK